MNEKNNTVIIGGIEYVPKEDAKNKNTVVCLDRFSTRQESKLHKLLQSSGYGFHDVPDHISEIDAVEKEIVVTDSANVCMIVGKSVRARLFLRRYVSIEEKKMTAPNLGYITIDKNYEGKEIRSKYSLKAVKGSIAFFEAVPDNGEALSIKLKHDYPITIENNDFKFVIAPRVDNDS